MGTELSQAGHMTSYNQKHMNAALLTTPSQRVITNNQRRCMHNSWLDACALTRRSVQPAAGLRQGRKSERHTRKELQKKTRVEVKDVVGSAYSNEHQVMRAVNLRIGEYPYWVKDGNICSPQETRNAGGQPTPARAALSILRGQARGQQHSTLQGRLFIIRFGRKPVTDRKCKSPVIHQHVKYTNGKEISFLQPRHVVEF